MKIFVSTILFLLTSLTQNLLFAQKSHFIENETGKIHYQTFGHGDPILIINGGPGFSSEGFQTIAEELASMGYLTILYDQRGTGKSTLEAVNETTITMDLMVEDIERIRQDLEVENWIVFGHSFGGMMAYYYAAKYSDRVSAMIQSSSGGMDLSLLGTAGGAIDQNLSQADRDSLAFWRERNRSQPSDANRKRFNDFFAKAYLYDDSFAPIVSERMMQGNMQLNGLVWQNMRSIDFDCKKDMRNYAQAVLILQGKNDILPIELAETAHEILPNSTLVLLDECGHYGWLDQKEKYYQAIEEFVDSAKN